MEKFLDFILLFLSQFAGGPGPVENNLVRFGLPAVLWFGLLYIAWSRQYIQDFPREKLLVWGFGLGFVRELYMFGQMAWRLLGSSDFEATCDIIQPLEHGLAMAAMVVVAGAFLRYILEDHTIAKRYLQIGITITVLVFVFTSWTWPRQLAASPQIKFHQTWAAWLFHIPLSILMGAAVLLLWRKRGWLRNVVAGALTFYLISELLLLVNYATARAYNTVICPIGNSLHILAIPLLGYVYLREQAIEKNKAEEELRAYRDHLEELVNERTVELTAVNMQLQQEVAERTQAEETLEQIKRRDELILESAGEGICGIDRKGNVIFANPVAARMLGYSADEMINQHSHAIWHQSNGGDHPHQLEKCPIYQGYNQGIQRYGDEEYFFRRDGAGFPVRYFSNPTWEKDELAGAVVVFQDITERKHAEAEIARRNASLATQNAVAARLSQSLEIDENLKHVLEIVQVESEMETGLIFLVDPDNGNLALHLYSGLGAEDDIQAFTAKESAWQQVSRQAFLRTKTVTASLAEFTKGQQSPPSGQTGIHTLISVPLVSKGRAVGVMVMGTKETAVVQSHKLDLLTAIGQQIGMAIENARLYQDSENWAGELTRLHEASSHLTTSFDLNQITFEITRQAAWLLKCSKACFIRVQSQSQQLEIAASFGVQQDDLRTLQDLLPDWHFLLDLANNPKTIAVRDAPIDKRLPRGLAEQVNVRAVLVAPIWSSKSPQEFIFLMDVNSTRNWHTREMELIESLANRAAVALMNANLHHQLELAAALEERQRIAANMHDGLAQTLSLLGLRVDKMQEMVGNDSSPETESSIRQIREVVAQASAEVRRSIASLQETPRPRSSIQDMLHELLEQFRIKDGPAIKLYTGTARALHIPPEQTDQVLPIVQEAILNAYHHAQAKAISVSLEHFENDVCLSIEDDGVGFDLEAPQKNDDHFGLSIMQARAARINCTFKIDTSPGNGTRITLTWRHSSNEKPESNISNLINHLQV